jgi:alkylation response protein AidB-like acyl-CoA dehydrogenase
VTTLERGISTSEDVLDAVERLAPAIAARAAEVEADRRLPADLLGALTAAGVFRLLRPAAVGGLEAALPDALPVYEALARADASVGWTALIGSASWLDLAGLPRDGFDELFAGAPDAITAGVFAPSGAIAAEDGGHRVTGRWSFASGCEHAHWIYGNCVEEVVEGVPRFRIAVFSPDQVTIEDTWTVSGLEGTGSHHFRVESVLVPARRTVAPMADPPCIDVPIARAPVPSMLALAVATVALGIARGALDDVLALAGGKVPLLDHEPLAANPTFHMELAVADTRLGAGRALIHETTGGLWRAAVEGTEPTLPERARIRAAATWATEQAADVVRAAHRAGGGGAVYATSPLQRRLRDIDALTQHFLVRRDTITTAGAILAGQDVRIPVF